MYQAAAFDMRDQHLRARNHWIIHMRATGDFPAVLVATEPFLCPNQVVHMPEPKQTVGTGNVTFLHICGLQKHLFLSVYNKQQHFTTTMPTAAEHSLTLKVILCKGLWRSFCYVHE